MLEKSGPIVVRTELHQNKFWFYIVAADDRRSYIIELQAPHLMSGREAKGIVEQSFQPLSVEAISRDKANEMAGTINTIVVRSDGSCWERLAPNREGSNETLASSIRGRLDL